MKYKYINPEGMDQAFESRKATAIYRVREFYRANYKNGQSDQAFLVWLETELKEADARIATEATQ